MSNSYLQLRRIAFSGPKKMAEMTFSNGVNVICGASDTGKSFLAESIDFMLGGSELRDIPERTPFGEVQFDLDVTSGEKWRFYRASSGGNFKAQNLLDEDAPETTNTFPSNLNSFRFVTTLVAINERRFGLTARYRF